MTQPLLGEGEDVTAMFSVPSVEDGEDVTAMFSVPSVEDGEDVTSQFNPSAKPAEPTSNVLANMGRSVLGGVASSVAEIVGGAAGLLAMPGRSDAEDIAEFETKSAAISAKPSVFKDFTEEQIIGMQAAPEGYRTPQEEVQLTSYDSMLKTLRERQVKNAPIQQGLEDFQKLSSEASKEAQTFFGQDPARQDEFLSKLATGAGSLPPYIASSIAGGPVASMMIGALQTGQNEYNAAIEAGKPELADEAMVKGMGIGLTEGAGVGGGQGKAAKGFAAKALVTLKKAFEEGGQEWVQKTLSNLNASTFTGYEPERPAFKGSGEALAIGTILGGGVEGVGQSIRKDPVLSAVAPSTAAAVARTQPVTVTVPEVTTPTLPSGSLRPPDPIVVEAEAAGAPQTAAALNQTMPPKPFAPRIEEPGTPTPYGRETDVFDVTAGLERKPLAAPAPEPPAKPAAAVEAGDATKTERMTPEEAFEKIEELLNAPTKTGGKPRVAFKTQAEASSFRRGFMAALQKPGETPPTQQAGVPAKEQKFYDAFNIGWSQAQMAIRAKAAPQGSQTPAAQPPAKPAAVVAVRDASKPEQMTPEEIDQIEPPKRWAESKNSQWVKDWRGNIKIKQRTQIKEAFGKSDPVSAAAVDAYGIKLPEGYTKRGDLYVYAQTQTESLPAVPQTPEPVRLSEDVAQPPSPEPMSTFDKALQDERRAYRQEVSERPVEQQPPRMWYELEAARTKGIGPNELTFKEIATYKQMWNNARKAAIRQKKPVYFMEGETPPKGWVKKGDLWHPPAGEGPVVRVRPDPFAAPAAQPPAKPTAETGPLAMVKGMIDATQKSIDALKNRITDVKTAPYVEGQKFETIQFNLDGKPNTAELKGRNRDLVVGTNEAADKAIAARTILDEHSTPVSEQAKTMRRKLDAGESGGIPASLFQDVADFGARIYRAGMDFAAWSKEMVRHLGERVRSALKELWVGMLNPKGARNLRGEVIQSRDQGGAIFAAGGRAEPKPGATVEGGREGEYYTRVAERDQGTLSDEAFAAVRRMTTIPDEYQVDMDAAVALLDGHKTIESALRSVKAMRHGAASEMSGVTDRQRIAALFLITQKAAQEKNAAKNAVDRAFWLGIEVESMADYKSELTGAGKALNMAGQLYANMPKSADAMVLSDEALLYRMTGGKAAEAEAAQFISALTEAMRKQLAEAMTGQSWATINQLEMVQAIAKLPTDGYAGKLNFEFKVTPPSKSLRTITLPEQAGMRESLATMLAKGLERNWWQALAGPRKGDGPLTQGVNSTSNQLAGILRQVMEARNLVSKAEAAKLTDAEKVAMFIGKKQLSEEAVAKVDESVSEEIEKRAQAAIEAADDAAKPAVEAQWAAIRDAWEEATSGMKTRPASNATMRRMLHAEAKTSKVDWDKELDAANDAALAERLAAALVEQVRAKTSGAKLPGFPALDLDALKAAALEQAQTVIAVKRVKYTERLLKRAIREQEAADSKAAKKYLSQEAAVERKAKALDAAAVRVMDKLQNSKQPKTESEKSQISKMHEAIRAWLKNPSGEQDLVDALVGIGLSEARASNVVSLVGRERSYMDREIEAIEVLRQAGKAESEADAIIRAYSPIIAKLKLTDAARKAVRDLFTEQFRANPERDQATFERDMTALGVPAEAATRLYQIANTHRSIREAAQKAAQYQREAAQKAAQYQRETGKTAQRKAVSEALSEALESIRKILMKKHRMSWDDVRAEIIATALNKLPFATTADRDAAADAMIEDFKARMEKTKAGLLKQFTKGTKKVSTAKLWKFFELGALDDAAATKIFMEKAGVQEFTPAFRDKLRKMYEDADKAPEGLPKTRLLGKIAMELALAKPKTFAFWWRLAMSVSYANILGAFTTVFVNNPGGAAASQVEMGLMTALTVKGAKVGMVKTWAKSVGQGIAMMNELFLTGENAQHIQQFDSLLTDSSLEIMMKMANDPSYLASIGPKGRAALKITKIPVALYVFALRINMAQDALIRWPSREALRFASSASVAQETRRPGQSLEDAVDELNYPGGRLAALAEAKQTVKEERKAGILKNRRDEVIRQTELMQQKLSEEGRLIATKEADELASRGSLLNDSENDLVGAAFKAIKKIVYPAMGEDANAQAIGGIAQVNIRFLRAAENLIRLIADYSIGYGAWRYAAQNVPFIGANARGGSVNLFEGRAGERYTQIRAMRFVAGLGLYASVTALIMGIDDDDEDPWFDVIGSGPNSADERKRLRDSKKMKFNAIKLGDLYLPLNSGPLSFLAGVFAPFGRFRDNKKWPKGKDEFGEPTPESLALGSVLALRDAIVNQSFNRGTVDALNAIAGKPTSFGDTPTEFIARQATNFIPLNFRAIQQLDEIVNGPKEKADGFFDTAARSIAFFSPNGRAVTILGDDATDGKNVALRGAEKIMQFSMMSKDDTLNFVVNNGLSVPDRQYKSDGRLQTLKEHQDYLRESGKMMRRWLETKNSKTGKTGMEMLQSIPEEVPGEKGKPINLRKKEMNKLWSEFRQVALLKQ